MGVKRVVDVFLALALSIIAAPIILLAALAVRLTSRGPGIYTQTRLGEGGRPFTIYKIRTMVHNCESLTGPRWAMPGDPRVTPVGALLRATHIDELPQLWNVLKGDMSMIGPRPERPEIAEKLSRLIPRYDERLAVRPGITGLAQIQLPPDTDIDSVERKLVLDLAYIEYIGPWLDLKIVACTALKMFGIPQGFYRRLLGSAHRLGTQILLRPNNNNRRAA